MSWKITAEQDPDSESISLGDLDIVAAEASEPVALIVTSATDRITDGVTVGVFGDDSRYIQLARDDAGKPGVWAAAGEAIIAAVGRFTRDDSVRIWARVIAPMDSETAELGDRKFGFLVRGLIIG